MTSLKKGLEKKTNDIIRATKPSQILALNKELRSVDDIVMLTVGEPDFNTPEHIKQAAVQDILNNDSHYAPSRGTAALLSAAASYLKKKYQLDYDPDTDILATTGVTEAIFDVMKTLINSGDQIVIPQPTFPVYASAAKVCGGQIIDIATAEDGFLLTADKLKKVLDQNPRVKAVVIASPGNPTGAAYDQQQIQQLAQIISQHDVFLISDEIYSELVYDRIHVSFAKALPQQTILMNGISKSHAMTGYRVGIIAAPAEIISQIAVVHELIDTALPDVTMAAAAEAFSNGIDDAKSMRQEYKKRRDFLISAFKKMEIDFVHPDGAFYLFFKIPDYCDQNSLRSVRQIAQEARVGLTPGAGFGAEGYLRLSYAASMADLETAAARLEKFFVKEKEKITLS